MASPAAPSTTSTPASPLQASSLHRVALLCFGGLGDVLLFSPVLAELKAWLPHLHLTLFVEERSLAAAKLLPHADHIRTLPLQHLSRRQLFFHLKKELKTRHYDALISTGQSPMLALLGQLSGTPYTVGYGAHWLAKTLWKQAAPLCSQQYASRMHLKLAEAFLSPLVGESYHLRVEALPQVSPPSAEAQAAAEALLLPPDTLQRPKYLLHPGVSQVGLKKGINKAWAPSRWAELILTLSKEAEVYLAGGPDDEACNRAILSELPKRLGLVRNLQGQLPNLEVLLALMQRVDRVLCVDSAPLHLAVASGTPVTAIFGPTDEVKLTPPGERVQVVARDDLACRPCLWAKRQQNCATSDCLELKTSQVLRSLKAH